MSLTDLSGTLNLASLQGTFATHILLIFPLFLAGEVYNYSVEYQPYWFQTVQQKQKNPRSKWNKLFVLSRKWKSRICSLSFANTLGPALRKNCLSRHFTSLSSKTEKSLGYVKTAAIFVFVALRPKSTAMVMAGRSVHLTTLFHGQAWTSS